MRIETINRIIFSGIIALINAICTQAVKVHACLGWDQDDYIRWGISFALSYIVVYILFLLLDKIESALLRKYQFKIKAIYKYLPFIFFLCWLPYFIVYLPGLLNYDTVNQVLDYFDKVAPVPFGYVEGQEEVTVLFNAHHPVFVSIIFGTFIKIGEVIGHPSIGLSLYILIQMIMASFVFSYAIRNIGCCFNKKDEAVSIIELVVIIFFAFSPFIPFYICIMLKNSLHSILVVLYITLFFKMIILKNKFSKRESAFWLILSLLISLTQNTGVYFVILSGLVLLFKAGKNRRIVLASIVAPFALMLIILPKVVYPAFNIFPGGKQEVLGALFQQTARFVNEYPDEITESDIAIISNVVDYNEMVNNFNYETTDDIKATYNLHVTDSELKAYYKLWLRQGLEHPDTYLRATLTICGAFFSYGNVIGIFDHIPSDDGIFAEIDHIWPSKLYESFSALYYYIESLPVIRFFFQLALYVLWIPLYCLYRIVTHKRKYLLAVVPFVVNMLFVVVSPMVYARYALPLIFTSPLLLLLCINRNKLSD